MPIRILYEASSNVGSGGDTAEDITSRVRLYTLDIAQNAEEGATAESSLIVDDPLGDYDIVGWRRVWAYEDTATGSNSLMGLFWTGPRTVARGESALVAAGRLWDAQLVDMNTLLYHRVMNGTDANRPAETDVQRIQWIMTTNEMSRITNSDFISTASPKNMDAADLRGQTCFDIINDCAQQSGKNFFVFVLQPTANTSVNALWYDFATSTAYSSPLRLSNQVSDVDGAWTFAISEDTTLTRDNSRTYSGAYVRYDGGTVYEESISTSNAFTRRDAVYDASNVKNATTATNRALRYLATTDVEEDRITTSFWVPAAKVNFVKQGMRIPIKATHLPGYSDFVWARVLQKKIKEVSEVDEAPGIHYLVSLELSITPGTTSPCGDLAFTQTSGLIFSNGTNTLPTAPAQCLQVWVEWWRKTPAPSETFTPPIGFTEINHAYAVGDSNNGVVGIAYRITQAGDTGIANSQESGANRAHMLYEFAGVASLHSSVSANDQSNAASITTGALSPTAGRQGLIIGAFIKTGHGIPGGNTNPDLGVSSPLAQTDEAGVISTNDEGPTGVVGYRFVNPTAGSYTLTATGDSTGFAQGNWAYVAAVFIS